jgi:3-oxoacid CoA-transferase subunit A
MMATAAGHTIAEVERLVPIGGIDPDIVVTPSIYIDQIFQGATHEKRIEQRTNRPKGGR